MNTQTQQTLGPIEVFRVGSFQSMEMKNMTYTLADLQGIAAAYDPVNAPAPIVAGHPSNDAPAYGWVESLYVEGEILMATIKDVVPEFAALIKAGQYKKISISLFGPDTPSNPSPGQWSLKHVGFLGAAAPAVPGLKPVTMSAGDGALSFALDPSPVNMAASDRAELETLRKQVNGQKLDDLVTQGRLLPVFKDEVLEFVASLDGTATFSFAQGKEQTPRDWFLSFLAKQPKVVSFGRETMPNGPSEAVSKGVVTPEGYEVDQSQSVLLNRARQLEREKNISFADAVDLAAQE